MNKDKNLAPGEVPRSKVKVVPERMYRGMTREEFKKLQYAEAAQEEEEYEEFDDNLEINKTQASSPNKSGVTTKPGSKMSPQPKSGMDHIAQLKQKSENLRQLAMQREL